MIARLLGILVLFTLLSSPAFGDFNRGMVAHIQKDYVTALREFSAAAEQGDVARGWAAFKQGDYSTAVREWRAAVEQGGVARGWAALKQGDYATALREFRAAVQQGNADAQTILGEMYSKGRGVRQNDAEAVRWYRRGAEQGAPFAPFFLGMMYDEGRGVRQNDAEAVRWYRRGAEQGDEQAQTNLGLKYAKGQGVPRDYVQAYIWTSMAAAKGIKEARGNLEAIEGQMTRDQIAEAQRWVRERTASGHTAPSWGTLRIPTDLSVLIIFGLVTSVFIYILTRRRGTGATPSQVAASSSPQHEAAEASFSPQWGDRGVLLRLLNGEVGLAKTFWLFWFLPVLLWTVLLQAFVVPIPSAQVSAVALGFFVMYKIVALRAVWLATARYSGPRVWSFLARLLVIIWVAVIGFEVLLIFELIGIF